MESGMRVFRFHQSLPTAEFDCSNELLSPAKRAQKGAAVRGDKKMLALITIFLVSLLTSVVAVWLYRTVSGWQGSSTTVVVRRGNRVRTKLKPQQGFISLLTPTLRRIKTTPVKSVQLRRSSGTIKAPWGW